MVAERALAFYAAGITLAMSQVGLLSLVTDPSGKAIRRVAMRWGDEIVRRLGLELHARGGAAVDWDRPLIVMANHNSLLDIPVLFSVMPRGFGMLAKTELFKIPIFGRAMRGIHCVAIDRGDNASSRESIARAAAQVRAGEGIVVFPEGTRGDGTSIRPFKKGPFHLAEAARVPIVPIGIRGTAEVNPKSEMRVRPGAVHVAIGDPIAMSGQGAQFRAELAATVRRAIGALSELPLEKS